MYCQTSFNMQIELGLPEIMDSLDLEIVLRYFLDDRDPTIQNILKEYGKPDLQSQHVYTDDGYITPNVKCFRAFNLNVLPSKGVDLNHLTYDDFITHVFENCVTRL